MAPADGCACKWKEDFKVRTTGMGIGVVVKMAQTVPYFFQFLFSKLFPNISFTFHQNPMQQVLYTDEEPEFMVSEHMCRHQRNNWTKEPQVLTHSLVYFV